MLFIVNCLKCSQKQDLPNNTADLQDLKLKGHFMKYFEPLIPSRHKNRSQVLNGSEMLEGSESSAL